MNLQGIPSQSITTIYSSQVQQREPIGEASSDLQESTLKPVEESAKTAKADARSPLDTDKQAVLDSKKQIQEQLEQEQIKQLAARDREVRNHERAHAAVGGQYASAPRYEYQRGPDGVSYAISGEVSINTSPVNGDPQMTIEKAQIIKRAALAPAEPSAQDRKVAAEAAQMEANARTDLAELQRDERLQEQQLKDERMAQEVDGASLEDSAQSTDAESDPLEAMNQTQEDIFNEINKDLASQLVSLGGAGQQAQSLGSIVSRFA